MLKHHVLYNTQCIIYMILEFMLPKLLKATCVLSYSSCAIVLRSKND